ncbi:MAG: chemotaxis protein CheX [Armatimonadetes bacterium JP3_11]|nr:MAG: chemotaxis protein CheX [Armatimonadetes bacterium CP1_7O]OYT75198.1 MAG: chemotaxis protein CheX [Armatimonadetes bacterium JP3_11]RMH09947.1 MAG: chemotaxis protein CheX [Armatimonadota bacterium]
MKAEYINPFISAAMNVFQMMVGITPQKGQLSARKGIFTSQQCNIVLGVTGQLEGQIIIGMSIFTADKIASKMLGTTIRTFDELAASAIAELGNMISGAALTELAARGIQCNLSPPSLIRGTNVRISTLEIPTLVVPLQTEMGDVEINVGLCERAK